KRLQGKTYEEIARAGGGIRLSARRVRQASVNSLVRQAEGFLRQFAAHGTITLEVKTGYGLEVTQELKLLEGIRRTPGRVYRNGCAGTYSHGGAPEAGGIHRLLLRSRRL